MVRVVVISRHLGMLARAAPLVCAGPSAGTRTRARRPRSALDELVGRALCSCERAVDIERDSRVASPDPVGREVIAVGQRLACWQQFYALVVQLVQC